jgi:hypothetical protein
VKNIELLEILLVYNIYTVSLLYYQDHQNKSQKSFESFRSRVNPEERDGFTVTRGWNVLMAQLRARPETWGWTMMAFCSAVGKVDGELASMYGRRTVAAWKA